MMLKVFDLLRNLGWGVISFIYDLIDTLLSIIKKLNSFDIINSLSNNEIFRKLYSGIMTISITLFALFIIWRIICKILDSDNESSFKNIMTEIAKSGLLIMLSTFLFAQVSNFSITLSNYTGNIFESSNTKLSNNMLTMFIDYNDGYKNSKKFNEKIGIEELVSSKSFDDDELYIAKYVTKSRLIFADSKDYKYDINWIMAIICGGFFLYSLFFASIMLGRRQIEFLFLFSISPIIFATSICNKQRRGAVIEQLVSLALQSAVVMLIVSLSVLVMQQVNATTFFINSFMNTTTKVLLYLGCATFILTGSQVVNKFIGANVSASNGREHLMSLMGYGRMANSAGGIALGSGLLATGGLLKTGKGVTSKALSDTGLALNMNNNNQTRFQKITSSLGSKMYTSGQKIANNNKFGISDRFINYGLNNIGNSVKRVTPRSSYNNSYYKRMNRF